MTPDDEGTTKTKTYYLIVTKHPKGQELVPFKTIFSLYVNLEDAKRDLELLQAAPLHPHLLRESYHIIDFVPVVYAEHP